MDALRRIGKEGEMSKVMVWVGGGWEKRLLRNLVGPKAKDEKGGRF